MSTITGSAGSVQTAAQIYAFKQAEAASANQVGTLLENLPEVSGSVSQQQAQAPSEPTSVTNNPDNLGQTIDIRV
ncbi:hypothetical protein LIN78_00910 [Leeia sp. TBRC 13508]|uniref:Motility protein n=1 Tax=Leeia speluncae TaxID=2884804 RepID=A0ABS8D1P1_9NEIS|nr:hypothetical protein [Leeia speluncae]MCB6182115.1 hypothetical protein [Leeia speluncae]